MAKKKISYEDVIFINDIDECNYHTYDIIINDKNTTIRLSDESNNLLVKDGNINKRYIDTIDLVIDTINKKSELYKIHSNIKNDKINITIFVGEEMIYDKFKIDSHIFNTCFGLCVEYNMEYTYVDFDKYF